jgi:hypothetical protein
LRGEAPTRDGLPLSEGGGAGKWCPPWSWLLLWLEWVGAAGVNATAIT